MTDTPVAFRAAIFEARTRPHVPLAGSGGNAVPGAQDGHGARVPTERGRAGGSGRPGRLAPLRPRARGGASPAGAANQREGPAGGGGAGVCEDAPRSLSAGAGAVAVVPAAAAAAADAEHRTRALRAGLGGEAMTSVRYGEGAARAARLLGGGTPTAAPSPGWSASGGRSSALFIRAFLLAPEVLGVGGTWRGLSAAAPRRDPHPDPKVGGLPVCVVTFP